MARHAFLDGAEDARNDGAAAWLRHRTSDRADQRRCALDQLRHVVPRVAETRGCAAAVRYPWLRAEAALAPAIRQRTTQQMVSRSPGTGLPGGSQKHDAARAKRGTKTH